MKNRKPGTIRIIGGQWRGTRLPVPDLPGLRPSGDRSRETLFNWLQTSLHGSTCADLFAGSGALGLEAASRGALRVVLVEQNPRAVQVIAGSIERLQASQVEVVQADAISWLQSREPNSLDIVFIDPPFDSGLAEQSLKLLVERNCVRPGGRVYVEAASTASAVPPGPAWQIDRQKRLGEVQMTLLKKT
jgi:16S rRNA (guanine966-N2)-methyltransferase